VDWLGERTRHQATAKGWRKWLPSRPTNATWYSPDHFGRLVAAHLADDADRGKDRTVRALVAEFDGLTGTAKQKAVLEATGLSRTSLSGLRNGDGLDAPKVAGLLGAMQAQSKLVKPAALGFIGKDHLAARFKALGAEMGSFKYRKAEGMTGAAPWVIEAAFAWCPDATGRRLITGVNWSPGIINPFRELGMGAGLDATLQGQRAGPDAPIVVALHLACPRVEYTDRGKSAVVIGPGEPEGEADLENDGED
jgi:DNA topoisomerase VI subunit B